MRERGWSTRQVGEAIKRSPMYVSRRLRVFDDDVLAPLVLSNQLPVSTAEELLREPDAEARREIARQAADEHWTQPVARREVAARRNVTLQAQSPRLASRIRALCDELASLEPGALSVRAGCVGASLKVEQHGDKSHVRGTFGIFTPGVVQLREHESSRVLLERRARATGAGVH